MNLLNACRLYFVLSVLLAVSGCNSGGGSTTSPSFSPTAPYCTTVQSFADPVTISGTARFAYRENGNSNVGAPKPIRYAEIRVLDGNGTVVQCGETLIDGTFSVQVARGTAALSVEINSRSANSQANAYILNNPTNNSHYSLSYTFTPAADVSTGTLTASATADGLKGGAFNILDQIHEANEFLRTQTAGCSGTYAGCQVVSTPPLVTVYWAPGVNPGSYFGVNSGLSFYIPGDRELYLLGGIGGDIDNSDTDHFDNSIILHEYGHFIEDVYSITDSPGGSHSGDAIIDPRLAWGEGWANFFQAAVTGEPVYRDSYGTTAGSAGVFFNENLEIRNHDTPVNAGEGNFREFSITRLLWDSIDLDVDVNDLDDDGVESGFAEFWATLSSTTQGFKADSEVFRSMGLFHLLREAFAGATNWSSLLAYELQLNARTHYANTLTIPGACGATTLTPADMSVSIRENGTFANSNQFASNDFYQYTHAGGTLTIGLSYTTSNSANPVDLDLLVWTYDYTFGSEADLVASSGNVIAVGSGTGSESLTANLPAGVYMINIHAYTGNQMGVSASYNLTINGQTACPD